MSTSRSGVMVALRNSASRRERAAAERARAQSDSGVRELDPSVRRPSQPPKAGDAPIAGAGVSAQVVPQHAAASVPEAQLAVELNELAGARTAADAHRIASRLRAKLGAAGADAYLKLVDTLVERAREHERLGRLAGSDELTGIANRRSFNDALRRELARTSRDGRPMALLMLDLDGLKSINDGQGHAEGDRALRLLARCASEAVRHGDIVARIGGDEFAVLLPNTAAPMANAVAQRIRDRLAAGCSAEPALQVGVSIGIAVANEATSRMDLLRAADAELYRDKAKGRRARDAGAALGRSR